MSNSHKIDKKDDLEQELQETRKRLRCVQNCVKQKSKYVIYRKKYVQKKPR
jgi:ElaB/YqjD/DUF883 family membrane-anchored ribosome-binding protein